ncbi:MAG: glycoside hydrolase family 16 protein [Oligoflexia bacterium]|nr:glycoside hydrolase family 16 protein [Oligoflexia bacterium]
MATVDSSHNGFSQQYGYFEMAASFPSDPGTWPAFWMLPANQSQGEGEIDIIEAYTQFNNAYCANLHDWSNTPNSAQGCPTVNANTLSGYHTYGMLWTASTMTFYFDGVQVWQHPTLSVMNTPYYMLVDLGIGGGWNTSQTTSPSVMGVKYVRAYRAP